MIATNHKAKNQIKRKFLQMGFESPDFDEDSRLVEQQKVEGDFDKVVAYVLKNQSGSNKELMNNITNFKKWVSEWTNESPKCRLNIERSEDDWHMEIMLYGYLPYNVFPSSFEKEIVTEESRNAEAVLKKYVDEPEWNQFEMKWLFAEWRYEKQFERREMLFKTDERKVNSLIEMEKILVEELNNLLA